MSNSNGGGEPQYEKSSHMKPRDQPDCYLKVEKAGMLYTAKEQRQAVKNDQNFIGNIQNAEMENISRQLEPLKSGAGESFLAIKKKFEMSIPYSLHPIEETNKKETEKELPVEENATTDNLVKRRICQFSSEGINETAEDEQNVKRKHDNVLNGCTEMDTTAKNRLNDLPSGRVQILRKKIETQLNRLKCGQNENISKLQPMRQSKDNICLNLNGRVLERVCSDGIGAEPTEEIKSQPNHVVGASEPVLVNAKDNETENNDMSIKELPTPLLLELKKKIKTRNSEKPETVLLETALICDKSDADTSNGSTAN